ncbi:hypothetical protein PVAND_011714 [Polypedilum vanderplanki]|uniref:Phosphate transporter n=1 Tax=Polypedilum vanderplanki TaxID=319348 RepID=A0A9J6CL87_POLVA|nr:hypothetical protein PVAND_011714 [Polypedilum vanderplanki]
MEPFANEILWIVILGFIVSFILAFAVGANDVANSYGTSVGSGVLTFKQACILATIFEISGSVLLGYKVADTMRKGILDVSIYQGSENVLSFGMLSALIGSAIWLLIATYFRLPVSTTHSIVGSTIGFSLVAHGLKGLNARTLGSIVLSWFVSPILSGLISIIIFSIIKKFIIKSKNPLNSGFIALPIIYGLTIFINVLSVTLDGSKLLGMENIPIWLSFVISCSAMILVAIIVQLFVLPWQKRKISPLDNIDVSKNQKNDIESKFGSASTITTMNVSTASLSEPVIKQQDESEDNVNRLFHFLQTLTAVFTSFAHGGNDVSNAIGPLIAIWMIYTEGSVLQKSESPIYLLLFGGVGMVIGLWILGKRVNETIGKNITKITPVNGFTVESSAATTVLLASKLGVPISSTHCIVGSVVFVGWIFGEKHEAKKSVDWSLFRSIIFAWLVTLPIAGAISAFCMWLFLLTSS